MTKQTLSFFLFCLLSVAPTFADSEHGHHAHDKQDHSKMAPSDSEHSMRNHHDSSSIGELGNAAQPSRTVNIEMNDQMRFTPAEIQVGPGETIRLVLKNTGATKHEFVLGTLEELKEHAGMMKKFPEMEHDEPQMLSLAPGVTTELLWRFPKEGVVHFACLLPGHMEAGMVGKVVIDPKRSVKK